MKSKIFLSPVNVVDDFKILEGMILLFYWKIDNLVKEFRVSGTRNSFVSESLYKVSKEPVIKKRRPINKIWNLSF